MKRVRSRREATGLISTDTRGNLADMPEAPIRSPDLFEKTRDHDRRELIDFARQNDLLPYFRQVESEAGPVVRMEGEERLMLGSNNYLGLTGDPRVKAAARDALERYGTALTGSRLLNGTIPLHAELEEEIAAWMGTEAALVFTTGYQANVGCLSAILSAERHGDRGLRRPRLDPGRLQDVRRPPAPLPPPAPRQARADAGAGRRRRRRHPGGRRRRLLDGGRHLRRQLGRRPLPLLRRPPDGGRGPRGGRARRPRDGRVRAARRRGPGRPAHGHVLQVPCQLRRLHRRAGRGDRLPADRLPVVPLHGRRRAGRARRRRSRRCGSAAPTRARSSSGACSTTANTCTAA